MKSFLGLLLIILVLLVTVSCQYISTEKKTENLLECSPIVNKEEYNSETNDSNATDTSQDEDKFCDLTVGDIIQIGSYEQDNDWNNGSEDVEWYVLAKDNDKALVISKYALDTCPFVDYDVSAKGMWENDAGNIRYFLNNSMLNTMFTVEERDRILLTTVAFERNPSYGVNMDVGNDTKDYLFLLSVSEVLEYYTDSSLRMCTPTVYAAESHGAYGWNKEAVVKEKGTPCAWWLRTTGADTELACYVSDSGEIDLYGEHVNTEFGFNVRPAMWIKLDIT